MQKQFVASRQCAQVWDRVLSQLEAIFDLCDSVQISAENSDMHEPMTCWVHQSYLWLLSAIRMEVGHRSWAELGPWFLPFNRTSCHP